jgi:uncharacterized membrane protein YbhN (UPF0104 family)
LREKLRLLAPLRYVVGPALLVVIALQIDRESVLAALVRARADLVVGGALVVLPAILLRAWRWNALLARMGHPIGGVDSLRLYAAGTFAGVATPGRLGEMVKVAPLVGRGVPAKRALWSVVLDRGFDVAIAVAAALAYAVALTWGARALAFVALAGALALVALGVSFDLRGGRIFALTAASSVCAWMANHLLVRSLGLPLGPLETAGVSAAAGLATLLPVSVLGIGTRDAALLLLLARYGVTAEDAIALATLFLFLNVWTGLTCGVGTLVPVRRAS